MNQKPLILSFFALLLCGAAMAQTSQQRLAAVNDTRFAGYDIVTVFDSTDVLMEESGLSHVYGHKLYKVLTTSGGRDFNTVKMDTTRCLRMWRYNRLLFTAKTARWTRWMLRCSITPHPPT